MACRRLALLVVLAACSKVKRAGQAGPGAHDGGVTVAVPTGEVPPEAPARELLRYLPADTELAIVVDLARLRKSPLYAIAAAKSHIPTLQLGGLAGVLASCPFQPARDVDRVLVASRLGGKPHDMIGVVAQGRFDEGPIMACVRQNAGPAKLVVRSESIHGRTVHHVGQDTILFLSRRTVVLGPEEWTARLASRTASAPPALDALAARVDTTQGAWWVGIPGSGSPYPELRTFWGALGAAAGLDIHIGIRFDKPETAQALVKQVDSMKTGVASTFGQLSARTQGEDTIIDMTMDDSQAERFLPLFNVSP